ncbi:helix-turn-helix domain-containing protein [Actinacidiphila glaucinigra]|uniref:helix-turn-helix domain-containing protein n=1 Tax=Actinacidiphila glaucinigra TaxID=235986 RepID=UPI0035DD380F
MTSNSKHQPLAQIIGERLKVFRDERELRQSDIARAAVAAGLQWARSSVAALETGARNLSVEELILLPAVIANAGGWDKPLIPNDAVVTLTGDIRIRTENLPEAFSRLFEPEEASDDAKFFDPDENELMVLGQASGSRHSRGSRKSEETYLHGLRANVKRSTVRLARELYYRNAEWRHVMDAAFARSDLDIKIADRIDAPDGLDEFLLPVVVAHHLYGRSAEEERDRRADKEGSTYAGRSRQSARGHATRELIFEIQDAIAERWEELRQITSEVRLHWDDVSWLEHWYASPITSQIRVIEESKGEGG